jgi:hypothetical protein
MLNGATRGTGFGLFAWCTASAAAVTSRRGREVADSPAPVRGVRVQENEGTPLETRIEDVFDSPSPIVMSFEMTGFVDELPGCKPMSTSSKSPKQEGEPECVRRSLWG